MQSNEFSDEKWDITEENANHFKDRLSKTVNIEQIYDQ